MSQIIDDDFLYVHMSKAEENMIRRIPSEAGLRHKFSKRFERKMNALLKYERRSPFMRSFVQYSKQAVAVILIALSIGLTVTMSVEAYRVRFFDFIIQELEELTSIVVGSDENADSDKLIPKESLYIPEGFEVIEQKISEYKQIITYANSNGTELVYIQRLLTQGETIIDTEGADIIETEFSGYNITIIENKGTHQLLWYDSSCSYTLIGSINKNELLTMAKNIIENK